MKIAINIIFSTIISICWVSVSSKAVAQPAGDYRPGVAGCGRYYATSDVDACLAEEASSKDEELKKTINRLMRLVDISKKENKEFGIKFFESQRLFEVYREYNCRAIEYNYRDGEMGHGFYYSCYIMLTDQRVKIIEHDYAVIFPN